MDKKYHLEILKQGVEEWNLWRQENPEVIPYLYGARLRGINLSYAFLKGANLRRSVLKGAILKGANLSGANISAAELGYIDLSHADLSNADLSASMLTGADLSNASLSRALLIRTSLAGANLKSTDLSNADLRGAKLSSAVLIEAKLDRADLNDANLSHANLTNADITDADLKDAILSNAILKSANLFGATLSRTYLKNADFSSAKLGWTTFVSLDLSSVKGLDTVIHSGPSAIGLDAIYQSRGNIPETFLRGAGIPDNFISYMASLTGKAFDFYSCFISYSSKDQAFAERLYADLQSKGVRCWLASEDMKIGERIRIGIDESIRKHDKLLLILSENSAISQWVEQEVETALARERQEKRTVLFPVRLDDTVMESDSGWPALIRNTRHIGDFRRWKFQDEYHKAFERLIRDLRAEKPDESSV